MKSYFLLPIALLLFQVTSIGQIVTPVKWNYHANTIDDQTVELVFEAKIDDGWAIYSQYLESDDGPIRTAFNFEEGAHFSKIGKTEESGNRKEAYDKLFEMNLIKFTKKAKFVQKVKIADYSKPITGYLEFMTCDDTRCLPPDDVDFEFTLEAPKGDKAVNEAEQKPTQEMPAPKEQVAGELERIKDAKTKAKKAGKTGKANLEKSTEDLGASQLDQNKSGGGSGKLKADSKKKSKEEETGEPYNTRDPKHLVDGLFKPVAWTSGYEDNGDGSFDLILKAEIDRGWHIYSRYIDEGDAIPFSLEFTNGDHFELVGNGKEESPKIVKEFDPGFDMDLIKLKEAATERQTIKTSDPSQPITGLFEFAVCDHIGCLPPELIPFKILPAEKKVLIGDAAEDTAANSDMTGMAANVGGAKLVGNEIDQSVNALQTSYLNPLGDCGEEDVTRDKNMLLTFIFGFLGGLVALLTPCVWPMIPLTVSFFTKGSKDRASGIRNGVAYGLSIIGIYVALGLLVTAAFGPDAMNILSTHWIPNMIFFVLFIVFAISFFGYFEITLPSSLANKSDQMAEKGGLIGTFFMAATLSIVSFSCTGPIIGSALVTAGQAGPLGPAVVMLGFSSALALPFGLFAAFPAWLNSLPQSGGWMTSVKVVLGFVELALALKFLSVADMTMHWGILKYELFLALWIIIALATAAYLFGFIRFPHDSPLKKLPPMRGALALVFLGFAGYLCTGFLTNQKTEQYNSLSLMSGLAPPAIYNYFKPASEVDPAIKKEYLTYSKCANNLDCFKDYYEGMDYAKKNNLPVLLDFTGYGCVNCRKTEEHIWIDDRVWEKLDQDFVLISLYVDDREKLKETLISKNSSKRLRNVGNKWADFQIVNFQQNSQPLYVMVTPDEQVLAAPRGYVNDVKGYVEFLECGLETFKATNGKVLGSLK